MSLKVQEALINHFKAMFNGDHDGEIEAAFLKEAIALAHDAKDNYPTGYNILKGSIIRAVLRLLQNADKPMEPNMVKAIRMFACSDWIKGSVSAYERSHNEPPQMPTNPLLAQIERGVLMVNNAIITGSAQTPSDVSPEQSQHETAPTLASAQTATIVPVDPSLVPMSGHPLRDLVRARRVGLLHQEGLDTPTPASQSSHPHPDTDAPE